jgi:transposase
VSPGQAADHPALVPLLTTPAVRGSKPGRPRQRPERIVADRAYSTAAIRAWLRRRGIGAVIPQPRSQRPAALIDWAAYRTRNVVERLVGRLKQFRRVATRYEKLAANYLAMVEIAAVRLMLRFENTP